jgi:hypothetical protein
VSVETKGTWRVESDQSWLRTDVNGRNGDGEGGGGGSCIYVLGEDESLDTVPDEFPVVIDPDGEADDDGGAGVSSWNDLKDKPFGDFNDTLVWDGNTEGLTFVQLDEEVRFYKVSDAVPTYNDCTAGGKTAYIIGVEEEFEQKDIEVDPSGMFVVGTALIVPTEAIGVPILFDEVISVTFAEAGTYFVYVTTGDVSFPAVFTYSLTINGYTGFPKSTKKIDGEYVALKTNVLYGGKTPIEASNNFYLYETESDASAETNPIALSRLYDIVMSGLPLLIQRGMYHYCPSRYNLTNGWVETQYPTSYFYTAEYTPTTTTEET